MTIERASAGDRLRGAVQRASAPPTSAAEVTDGAARLHVAATKGLTAGQARRLVGRTVAELEADADRLLADLAAGGRPEPVADFDSGARFSAPTLDMSSEIRRRAGR